MNAFDVQLQRAIGEAILEYNRDDELLVAVITGEGGRAFCTGGDLKEMTEFVGTDQDPRRTGAQQGRPGVMAVGDSRKPVIAAVDGYALAGGCELALLCDFRLATRQSTFAVPEVKRSLIAGPGTTHLARLIPHGEALLMAMTGDPITAERAYQVGLVQRLVEDRDELFKEVEAIMDSICANPPLAVHDVKHVVKVGVNLPLEYHMYFREKYFDSILQTEDAIEGAAAFAEKRPPVWKMR